MAKRGKEEVIGTLFGRPVIAPARDLGPEWEDSLAELKERLDENAALDKALAELVKELGG